MKKTTLFLFVLVIMSILYMPFAFATSDIDMLDVRDNDSYFIVVPELNNDLKKQVINTFVNAGVTAEEIENAIVERVQLKVYTLQSASTATTRYRWFIFPWIGVVKDGSVQKWYWLGASLGWRKQEGLVDNPTAVFELLKNDDGTLKDETLFTGQGSTTATSFIIKGLYWNSAAYQKYKFLKNSYPDSDIVIGYSYYIFLNVDENTTFNNLMQANLFGDFAAKQYLKSEGHTGGGVGLYNKSMCVIALILSIIGFLFILFDTVLLVYYRR